MAGGGVGMGTAARVIRADSTTACTLPCPSSTALDGEDGAAARNPVRGLIKHITLHPETDGYRVDVRGELAAVLGLADFGIRTRQRPRRFHWASSAHSMSPEA